MKKSSLKKFVLSLLVLTLVFTLLSPSFPALANETQTSEEVGKSVDVSKENIAEKIKYELTHYDEVGLTKEEAEENYRIYQSLNSSEREEFTEVVNSPEKLEQAIEKSGDLEVVETPNLLKASAQKKQNSVCTDESMGDHMDEMGSEGYLYDLGKQGKSCKRYY